MSETGVVSVWMMIGLILIVVGFLLVAWEMFMANRAERAHKRLPRAILSSHHVYLALIVLGVPLFIVNLVNLITFMLV